MKDLHKKISDFGLVSKICIFVFLYVIVDLIYWAMESTRDGVEIAAIMGATLTPIAALLKFIMEWSDRKNESHT